MSTFNGYPVATNGYVDTDSVNIDAEYVDTDSINVYPPTNDIADSINNEREAKLKMAGLYGKSVYAEIESIHKEPDYQFNAEERAYFNFLVNNRKYTVNEAIKAVVEYKRQPDYMSLRNMHEFM